VGLSQNQIYTLARQAGLSDAHAVTAAAIAMAESGGDPNNHNSTPPDDSYGLWQINMLGSLGPARRALYRLSSNEELYNPATNARVMSSISRQGQNFNPWTTYTSGKYKQFLGGVTAKDAGGADSGGLLGTIVDDAKSVATLQYRVSEAIVKTTLWVTTEKNWLRVGYVLVGGAAVLAGTLAVINSTSAGATAVGAAKKAAVAAAV
jgi:hypothetical protein